MRKSGLISNWTVALIFILTLVPAFSWASDDALLTSTAIDEGLANGKYRIAVPGGVAPTTLRNQQYAEDCWAFTTAEWMEENSRAATPEAGRVSVSPEHFLFWHVYAQIKDHLNTYSHLSHGLTTDEKIARIKSEYALIKNDLIGHRLYQISPGSNMDVALHEINRIGAVPKSAYPVNLTTELAETFFEKHIKTFVGNLILNPEKIQAYMDKSDDGINDRLFTDLARSFKAVFKVKPYRPTESFEYRGRQYTPLTFMKDRLNFEPADFGTFQVNAAFKDAHSSSLDAIAQTLLDGDVGVPIGFDLYDNDDDSLIEKFKANGIFTEEFCRGGACKEVMGGHEVMGVNFIYQGDESGYKPGDKIVAIIIKNTWGPVEGSRDVNGQKTEDKSKIGHYIITSGYLKKMAHDPRSQGWDFAIPLEKARRFPKLRAQGEPVQGSVNQCRAVFGI